MTRKRIRLAAVLFIALIVMVCGNDAMMMQLQQPGYGPDYHLYRFFDTRPEGLINVFH